MGERKLTMALVGCGQIADAHLQEIRKVPGVEPVAVCDRHLDLARQAADRFGVPGVYADLARLLDEARPDVVHIATPPHTHYALARQALAAGAHVYVEKPFTVDAAEAEEVIKAGEAAGRLVCAGHDHLFDPAWRECRAVVDRGDLGEVVHVESVMGYPLWGPFGRALTSEPDHWVHRLPGGLFQNNLSHAVCKVTDLIPDERLKVWATWFGGAPGRRTELRATLRGERATANIVFTSAVQPVQRIVRVYGTRRALEVDFDGRFVRSWRPTRLPGPFARIELSAASFRQGARAFLRNVTRFLRRDLHYFASMARLFDEFYAAVRTGRPSPVPAREILRVTAVMDDIFRACQDGEPDGLCPAGEPATAPTGGRR